MKMGIDSPMFFKSDGARQADWSGGETGETVEAGRELDALVAEKIMGWNDIVWRETVTTHGGEFVCKVFGLVGKPPDLLLRNEYRSVPHYSMDIVAAWEIVEKMASMDFISVDEGEYYCGFRKEDCLEGVGAYAATAPLAICLAALRVVGE